MNIPKSYEALAADLASEKIISKTLLGQKEAYMMLADGRNVELDAALAREAELRESLADKRDEYNKLGDRYDTLQHRLTVAEHRYDILRSAAQRYLDFRHVGDCGQGYQFSGVHPQTELKNAINGMLKLAKEGAGS